MNNRFQDENLRLSDFEREVWVVCPACAKKAVATLDSERKTARLFCDSCGCHKETTTDVLPYGTIHLAAHSWFGQPLWLQAPFRNGVFYAYNFRHLEYLERYIGATLREHKGRTHFTLLEKLPRFYHDAKNREGLLKLITRLKNRT
ncbi:MAG: hypothetical protein K0M63_05495 [Weeksellaceae bacterium]|nr:hypothetical protein [Weeksellaceae bacterium]